MRKIANCTSEHQNGGFCSSEKRYVQFVFVLTASSYKPFQLQKQQEATLLPCTLQLTKANPPAV